MATSTDLLNLEIATPAGLALRTRAGSVQAPSVHGEFGVLPGHLPLLAALKAGILRYEIEGKAHLCAIGPGFVEAGPDKVLVLTDFFARPEDVDVEATKKDREVAEAKLAAHKDSFEGQVYEEIVRDLDWADAKLKIVES